MSLCCFFICFSVLSLGCPSCCLFRCDCGLGSSSGSWRGTATKQDFGLGEEA